MSIRFYKRVMCKAYAIKESFVGSALHLLYDAITLSLHDKRKLVDDLILLCFELAEEHSPVLLQGGARFLKDVILKVLYMFCVLDFCAWRTVALGTCR